MVLGSGLAKLGDASIKLLWDFVQYWRDDSTILRPKVAEVVDHLEEVAANWNTLTPPGARIIHPAEDADSIERCEFKA